MRWRYDVARSHQAQVWQGNAPLQDEVAVFLIYQETGVSDSILFTLSWLKDQGAAAVVVSNAPLTDSDKTRLMDLSYLVIQRPNLGYDFGGYREGILTVLERGTRRYHLHPEAPRLPLSGCDHGPVYPEGSGLADIQHAGG